jgi:competence protein ComEC
VAHEGNPQSRARTRAWTWPVDGARQVWGVARPRAEFLLATKIRKWAIEEVAAGRLFPWFAVTYGFGIVLYFTAEREPASWAAIALAFGCAAAAIALRRRLGAFVIALGLFAMAAGFAVATVKTALTAHPVLRFPASGVTISGFVELREESQHTDRFVLRVDRMEGGRMDDKPERVRLSVKRGTAPPAGCD